MEDDLGRVPDEDGPQAGRVGDAGDGRDYVGLGRQGSQLAFEEEQAILGVIQQDQLPGVECEDLAANLRADTAGGAGDQDDPIVQEAADRLTVEMDRLAAEQITDIHIPRPNVDGAAQQGGEWGDDLDLHPQRAASGGECAQALPGERRCGDQDRPDPQAAGVVSDGLRGPENLDTAQRPAVGGVIRVKEAYDLQAQLGLAPDGVCHRLARRAGPDDQDALLHLGHLHVVVLAKQPEGSP